MDSAKIRIAYDGDGLQNGAIDINELAPALLSFSQFLQRANSVIGNTRPIKVMLKADDVRKGSFDITLEIIAVNILEQARMFMGMADKTGLKDLLDILGYGVTGKDVIGNIFDLFERLGTKSNIKASDNRDGTVSLSINNAQSVIVTNNVYNLYRDYDSRKRLEEIVRPLKSDEISKFELRNPNNPEDKRPIVQITKDRVDEFKAPTLKEDKKQENQFTQIMILKVVSPTFDENLMWRFHDGNSGFMAKMNDVSFLKKVADREIVFGAGDQLKVKCTTVQILKSNGNLTAERTIDEIIEVIPKPKQMILEFDE